MPNSESLFRGVGVALASLFDDAGALDVAATVAHAERLVERGVRAVLVTGTTGEFWSLSESDRTALVTAIRKALPSNIPVMAGTGANSTTAAVRLTSAAVQAGADAVLVLPPRGSLEILDYYNAVGDAAAGRPVIGYHMPLISPPGLAVEQLDALPIQGIKDSSLEPRRLLAELDLFKGYIYTGVDSLLSYAGPLGCAGAFGALANVEPELSIAAFGGNAAAQRRLAPIERAALEQFPVGLKKLMNRQFGTSTALGRGTAAFLKGEA